MQTKIIKDTVLPAVLPHGWKTRVAKAIGVHPNTVKNNLQAGQGETYDRIMHTAKQIYGIPKNR